MPRKSKPKLATLRRVPMDAIYKPLPLNVPSPEDFFLMHHVPTDSDATEKRARLEAAAWLRQGVPMVTLHCAPLKLPSGIRGERWYVLTPEIHQLMPGSQDQNVVARLTLQGESHDEAHNPKEKKRREHSTGKPTGKRGDKSGNKSGRGRAGGSRKPR